LAFAFEAPRDPTAIITMPLPAISPASHSGTCRGGLAPSAAASAGSQSRIGAGSSSVML
jgi:hypothetical protein